MKKYLNKISKKYIKRYINKICKKIDRNKRVYNKPLIQMRTNKI